MSRYLTPHKISLLVLASLYCERVVPTSATIPVLSFIVSHIITPAPSNYRERQSTASQDAVSSINAFDNVTLAHISSVPGRTLLDLFLKRLWAINSFDALHTFFDELSDILAGSREDSDRDPSDHMYLSRSSPLGTFVRRAQLEFTRLQFHDAVKLWSAFLKYKAPSAQWTRRIAGIGIDVNVTDLGLRPGDGLFQAAYGHLEDLSGPEEMVSVDDIERILEFQVDRIQRMPSLKIFESVCANLKIGLGCRLPDDMRTQLRSMIGPTGTVLRSSHLVK
jgi:anaphase-promoting complex subunit 5